MNDIDAALKEIEEFTDDCNKNLQQLTCVSDQDLLPSIENIKEQDFDRYLQTLEDLIHTKKVNLDPKLIYEQAQAFQKVKKFYEAIVAYHLVSKTCLKLPDLSDSSVSISQVAFRRIEECWKELAPEGLEDMIVKIMKNVTVDIYKMENASCDKNAHAVAMCHHHVGLALNRMNKEPSHEAVAEMLIGIKILEEGFGDQAVKLRLYSDLLSSASSQYKKVKLYKLSFKYNSLAKSALAESEIGWKFEEEKQRNIKANNKSKEEITYMNIGELLKICIWGDMTF